MKFPLSITVASLLGVLLAQSAFPLSSRDKLARAIALEQSGVQMEAVSTYEDYLKDSPNDAAARGRLVAMLVKMNDLQRALPHITLLRIADPNNPQYQPYFIIEDKYRKQIESNEQTDYETRIKQPNVQAGTFLEYSKFLHQGGDEKGSMDMLRRYLAAKPGDNAARLDYAKRLSWRKDFGGAREQVEKLVAADPNNVEAYSLLGDLFFWKGDEEAALNAYRHASAAAPNNQEIKRKVSKIIDTPGYREKKLVQSLHKDPNTKQANELAKLYLDAGRTWEADSLVAGRLGDVPNDADALKLKDLIQKRRAEDYAKKIQSFKVKLRVAPNDTTVMLGLARFYASEPSFDSSLAIYDSYMRLYPLDYEIRLERAKILTWSGKTADAAQEFRIISLAQPDNKEANIGLAECLVMEDTNNEEAEQIFRRELARTDDTVRVRVGMADALRRQGRYEEARDQYQAVLVKDPKNERAQKGMDWLNSDLSPLVRRLEKAIGDHPEDLLTRRRLAGLYYDAHRYWDAEQQVNYLLAGKPDDSQLEALLADIKLHETNFRSVELDSLQRQVAENPDDWKKRSRLAEDLAAIGRLDEATNQYKMVIEQRPNDMDIRVKLGEMLANAGKLKEAAEVYSRIADDQPGNYDYRVRLAQIYSWMGQYDAATAEYDKALRITPNSVDCQLAIADIARWRGDPYSAYDSYSRVLAMNTNNERARKAIEELTGTLVRGVQGYIQDVRDSEHFKMRETRIIASVNLTLRMRTQAGWGNVHFEQLDAVHSQLYAETGWFIFGHLDYKIDPLTSAAGELKFYTFQYRRPRSLRLEVSHDFQDMPSVEGLVGLIYYQSQEAVFDLASTHNLSSWTRELSSDKIGLNGRYNYSPKWQGEGELAQYSISDGNGRTDFWGEWRRVISKLLQVGARYESVSAKRSFDVDPLTNAKLQLPYWAPDNYQTISVVGQLQNSLSRWSYTFHGAVGRVMGTNDALRNFNAQIQWRVSSSVSLSAAMLDLATTRVDGQYTYRGVSVSVTVER